MPNVIAVIWDSDKIIVDDYMQDPLFKEYKINDKEFWNEVNSLPENMKKSKELGLIKIQYI